MKRWLILLASALLASGVQASPILFTTSLSGAAENPPVPSMGSGTAQVLYDSDTSILTVSVTFQDLVGMTSVAHIHCCTANPLVNAGVATFPGTFPGFPAGVTSGSYLGSWDLSQASSYTAAFLAASGGTEAMAEAALVAGMHNSSAYVNVHSSFSPGGEIKGFLAAEPIPEPTALPLFAIGLLFVGRRIRSAAPARA